LFEEINGKLMNMMNVDRIEKYEYKDGKETIYELHYYSNKGGGIIKEPFKDQKERDAKYNKFKGTKKGLLG
jgi:hypothetical protein